VSAARIQREQAAVIQLVVIVIAAVQQLPPVSFACQSLQQTMLQLHSGGVSADNLLCCALLDIRTPTQQGSERCFNGTLLDHL
jgi:hypothetical protein